MKWVADSGSVSRSSLETWRWWGLNSFPMKKKEGIKWGSKWNFLQDPGMIWAGRDLKSHFIPPPATFHSPRLLHPIPLAPKYPQRYFLTWGWYNPAHSHKSLISFLNPAKQPGLQEPGMAQGLGAARFTLSSFQSSLDSAGSCYDSSRILCKTSIKRKKKK